MRRSYGSTTALEDCSLALDEGRLGVVLGPSGSGKTTLLRAIAGLDPLDAGRIRVGGRDLVDVPSERRGVGLVFQDGVLFPHLDVAENVAFGLRVAGEKRGDREARVTRLLDAIGLAGFARRRVDGLSGGERQRVALARALAPAPRLLLLDEPFASLDRRLREEQRRALARLQRETGVTMLLVTHDQDEALELADSMFVMDKGRVVESGAPADLLARPRRAFTARFLGLNVLTDAHGSFVAPDLRVAEPDHGRVAGRVVTVKRERRGVRLIVEVEGAEVSVEAPGAAPAARDERVALDYSPDSVVRLT
ncbi:MAG: ABC transporter ATP-binding protein [Thermoplasmatota archaeon]